MKKPRIVVVDDHSWMRRSLQRLLESDSEVVGDADNGRRALEIVESKRPDIVVLDISMPVMDGLETARRLFARDLGCQVIFLTVHDDPETVEAAMATGARGFIVKSRAASDLTRAIREVHAGRTFRSAV